jgi:site-specific DNA-methyltransferase (adenine-specific)
MEEMPSRYVDLILADPPYGTTNIAWDKTPDLALMWSHFEDILKPTGLVVLTCNQPFTSLLVISNRKWFKYDLVWSKNKSGSPGLAKIRPLRTHEDILIFSPSAGTKTTYNPQMEEGEAYSRKPPARTRCNNHGYGFKANKSIVNHGTRYPKSVLQISRDFSAQQQVHPTQKPVPLMEWLLLTYSNEGDVVFDPYMGSGSTGVAAVRHGRKFVGCETEKPYFKIAKKRVFKEL